jgi:bifunctional UDP-N-acetylglucosamine pyrophosphorylase/glucosamine-1-phosphate N-acetyltransferase
MRSPLPKVLHPLCGRPLGAWPVHAALDADAHRVVVVTGPDRALDGHLPAGVRIAVQEDALGTGHAVRCAAGQLERDRPVVVLAGDVPLVTAGLVRELVDAHARSGAAATILTMRLEDPAGYGRVVRDASGAVARVVETKAPGDATAAELAIDEVNTGVLCFDGGALLDALAALRNDNAQGEYYLPDTLAFLRSRGQAVAAHVTDDASATLGVNDQADLARVRALAQRRIVEAHLAAGVTVVDPARTVLDASVVIGAGTVLEPGCQLEGATIVGPSCRIGPQVTLRDTRVGARAVVRHAFVEGGAIPAGAVAGPSGYVVAAPPRRAAA